MLTHLIDNLHQAQNRMKQQANQHHSECTFQEGDQVFLRLQPYKKTSLKDKGHYYVQNSMDRIKYFSALEK